MEKTKNIPLGIVGGLIGAVPGVILWLLLAKIGFIASICGIAILIGVVVGYTTLGKSLDIVGIIISFVIVIFAVYMATKLNWSIQLYSLLKEEDSGYSFAWCFRNLETFLEISKVKGEFIKDLVIGYIFTILGVVSYLVKMFKKH